MAATGGKGCLFIQSFCAQKLFNLLVLISKRAGDRHKSSSKYKTIYTKLSEKLSNMCKSFVTHIWFHKSLSPPKTFPINRNYLHTVSDHGNSIYLTVTRSAWSHITIY